MEAEIWKKIPGASAYEASNLGRIKRVVRAKGARYGIRNAFKDKAGYERLAIVDDDGRCHPRLVHRLVCAAFRGLPPKEQNQCAHYDGNQANNHIDNLRWASPKENHDDAKRHGTAKKGETNGTNKLTEKQVIAIRSLSAEGMNHKQLALMFRVTSSNICLIVNRRRWAHVP